MNASIVIVSYAINYLLPVERLSWKALSANLFDFLL